MIQTRLKIRGYEEKRGGGSEKARYPGSRDPRFFDLTAYFLKNRGSQGTFLNSQWILIDLTGNFSQENYQGFAKTDMKCQTYVLDLIDAHTIACGAPAQHSVLAVYSQLVQGQV